MKPKYNTKINIELNIGDVLEIYTDFKEEVGYEGKAVLVEKLKNGDSYYLRNEDIRPEDKKEYSQKDLNEINK